MMNGEGDSHFYSAHGLVIQSCRPLPGLISTRADSSPDVYVCTGPVELPGADRSRSDRRRVVDVRNDEVVIHWRDILTLSVQNGQRIRVDQLTKGENNQFTGYLIVGTALGVLLHQRHRLTLHASAVNVDGSAIAFAGDKGMGKSTTAAAFMKQGYPVITDDVLAPDLTSTGTYVFPGERFFKLWPDAATTTLQSRADGLPRLHSDTTKKVFKFEDNFEGSLPLKSIYFLKYCEEKGGSPRIEEVEGSDSYIEMLKKSYALRFLGDGDTDSWFTKAMAKISNDVSSCNIIRKKNTSSIFDSVKMVKYHISKNL